MSRWCTLHCSRVRKILLSKTTSAIGTGPARRASRRVECGRIRSFVEIWWESYEKVCVSSCTSQYSQGLGSLTHWLSMVKWLFQRQVLLCLCVYADIRRKCNVARAALIFQCGTCHTDISMRHVPHWFFNYGTCHIIIWYSVCLMTVNEFVHGKQCRAWKNVATWSVK